MTTKYYFARGPQLVNRVVDISSTIDAKVQANLVNKTQGPAGENGARLRASLAAQGRKLDLLGNDDATANLEYVKQIVFGSDRELGQKYGVEYAEQFHYIGPPEDETWEVCAGSRRSGALNPAVLLLQQAATSQPVR